MLHPRAGSPTVILAGAAVFTLAAIVALWVVRPFATAPIGPDAAAPVIDFQRLLAGQQLEGYLSQTPKPLLTLVYGVARVWTGDWRTVSLLAIGSYAGLVAVATWLAFRIGGLPSAAFAGVGLALEPQLLIDVTFAYGVSWAMLACALAAVAVLARRPRFGMAGIALALGALARPEILAVTALALIVVAGARLAAVTGRVAPPPASAWLLGLGLLAIPVFAAHDWVLKGDPWFWLNTAQANSLDQGNVRTLFGVVRFVGRHILALGPLVALTVLAVAELLVRRRWTTVVVVAIVPVAVSMFFIASGARGTVITSRYLMPIDLSLIWSAGIGLAAIDLPRLRDALRTSRLARRRPVLPVLGVVVGASLALLVAPSWPLAGGAHSSVAAQRAKEANAAEAFAALSGLLPSIPDWRDGVPPDAHTVVLIPPRLRAQGIVDLDLPLWAGTKSSASAIDPAHGQPPPGTIVYHDARDDKPDARWDQLEISEPAVVDGVRLVPLFTDEQAGIWIVRVDPA